MKALSSLGIGLSLVSGFLLLALFTELYYLLWWKRRINNREMLEDSEEVHTSTSPAKELLYLFCWKKPSSLSSTALNPQDIASDNNTFNESQHKDLLIPYEEEEMEAELMRLHNLSGPPRILFTIKEETKEDLESQISRKSSRGRSLSDVFTTETPFLTPLSSPPFFTPPLTPYNQQGFNPLFESFKIDDAISRMKASPPPKFKFLRDAEEKLYKKTLTEEAMRVHKFNDALASPSKKFDEKDGSFITILVGKNGEKGDHQSSSQPSPLSIKHGKLGTFLSTADL